MLTTPFKALSVSCVLIVLIACPLSMAQSQIFPKLSNVKDFDDFLRQTGKVYIDPKERQLRESLFIAKKAYVDLGNKNAADNKASFTMNLNTLADLTHDEVSKLYGSKISFSGENLTSTHVNFVTSKSKNLNLPEHFDWRELGGVTPPDFQGFQCGACWSFATVGALEGHLFRRTGLLVPLSAQNLVDCAEDYGTTGCDGGFQEYAFEYIRDHGISVANRYPYIQSENPECGRNETTDKGVYIRDYARIKPGDEEKMREVIATLGPVACSINADTSSFEQYIGGIYDDDACNEGEVNHSVLVVGYGSKYGRDYWIVKNSYSANWGENGFFKLPRYKNSCGIATECSFPIL
ncbi:procathepsin L [Stomoxys calcitrans]|uniref:Peptidase C1A papain C-terminal domain-containing protein n=1 Tax=Stomoxys calcitrans TaxID=35570 RepID=A0A1I8QEB4_STOCA|nr:procathepsin L [Stomoxys calcitrans]